MKQSGAGGMGEVYLAEDSRLRRKIALKVAEAIVAVRKGREPYDSSSRLISFIGYALAKSSRRAEAQAELEGLLKLSTERYIPPYNIAMIYNGLGDTDKTWLGWKKAINSATREWFF